MHAASPAFWMVPSSLSTTPLFFGLWALVRYCLQNCLHFSPNSPPKNSPPLSDLPIATFEVRLYSIGAHVIPKLLKTSPESDLCFRKHTHALARIVILH